MRWPFMMRGTAEREILAIWEQCFREKDEIRRRHEKIVSKKEEHLVKVLSKEMTGGDMYEALSHVSYKDWEILLGMDESRPYLQVRNPSGACNVTGERYAWTGRKWFLSPYMTRSELVQTALKAVLTAEEHEARENFLYRGVPIFDPHYDVEQLRALRMRGDVALDEREKSDA